MERTESVRASAAPVPAAALSPTESDMPPDLPRAGLFNGSLPSSSLRSQALLLPLWPATDHTAEVLQAVNHGCNL